MDMRMVRAAIITKRRQQGRQPVLSAEPVELLIHDISHVGAGVGKALAGAEQRIWFVPGALPGERVLVRLLRAEKRYCHGQLLEVLSASAARVTPPCVHASRCGGCGWQHIAAEQQADLKRELVAAQLRHLGLQLDAVHEFPPPLEYRRRTRMHYRNGASGMSLGFRAAASHELVDIDQCPVLDAALNHALQQFRQLAPDLPASGVVQGLSDGQRSVLSCDVTDAQALLQPAAQLLDDVLVGIRLRDGQGVQSLGQAQLLLDAAEDLPGMPARADVFSQAQSAGNRRLVERVAQFANVAGQQVLELYCGAGNFTRALAPLAQSVLACDDNPESVALLDAFGLKQRWPLSTRIDSAEQLVSDYLQQRKHFDVVVLDPPRAGLGQALARDVAALVKSRMVYVSCNPLTLVQDLNVLLDEGFAVEAIELFDLMPMTPEVELLAVLSRKC